MKSKFLQQIKLISDATTTGVSRKGFNSALIIVQGGTNNTDIKIQDGSVAGTTADYLTLGKATGAGTVVSFQLDISGCKEYVKITGTSLTGAMIVLGDADVDPADTSSVLR